jgi:hypothetical protein
MARTLVNGELPYLVPLMRFESCRNVISILVRSIRRMVEVSESLIRQS